MGELLPLERCEIERHGGEGNMMIESGCRVQKM